MKDRRLIELRMRAERDLSLSDGAFRLLCRLVSEKYVDPTFFAEESFALPWTKAQKLCGISERQSYRRIDELANYIASDGLKNCPPTAHFHFLLNSAKNGGIESAKNGRNDSAKKGAIDSAKNGRNHISNPFRKELDQKKEGIRARRGRGDGVEGKIERRPEPSKGKERRSAPKGGVEPRPKHDFGAMRKAAS